MRALAAALLVCAALPARAEMAFKAEDLLAARETALAGAMIACATGVTDPAAAVKALTGAGWTKGEGETEGTSEYSSENLGVMLWDTPGFCMVSDTEAGTQTFADDFLGLSNTVPEIGTDVDGCTTYTLEGGVIATLSGPGQDPECTSETGAALRFMAPN